MQAQRQPGEGKPDFAEKQAVPKRNVPPQVLVLGVGVGYMLRGRSFVSVTKWSIQITVCVLLFVFGVSIGSDRNLVDNFYNFGWQAAVIACLGVLGSIVAARVAQRLFFKKGGES